MRDPVFVLAGLALLFLGGDFLVRGAVSLANRLEIAPLVIAITVVAFGTSVPELIVSLDAALAGAPAIAIGNVVGSNIANVLLVLGLSAIVAPIVIEGVPAQRNTLYMVLGSLIFLAVAWGGEVVRWEGIVLFLLLLSFLYVSYRQARRDEAAQVTYQEEVEQFGSDSHSPMVLAGFIVGGLAGLIIGAQLLVEGAVEIARSLGVSEAVIGLTMVAFGTSLPELVTSIVAIARKHGDVAIGNILGSNLFNIFGVLGITSIVIDIPVPDQVLSFDIWVMLGAAVLLVPFALRWISMSRPVGILLFVAYIAYVGAQFGVTLPGAAAAG